MHSKALPTNQDYFLLLPVQLEQHIYKRHIQISFSYT